MGQLVLDNLFLCCWVIDKPCYFDNTPIQLLLLFALCAVYVQGFVLSAKQLEKKLKSHFHAS